MKVIEAVGVGRRQITKHYRMIPFFKTDVWREAEKTGQINSRVLTVSVTSCIVGNFSVDF